MSEDRFDRQRRLAEVGDLGQARIESAAFEVRGGDGAVLETVYLQRAGAERVTLSSRKEPEAFAHERAFHHAASRRVGAGAWRALVQVRNVLGIS